ncbi:hypothetical protein, partial [Streptomyces tateyamensis]|uniref:hypothetical protein n=1 Tax=Streptomyces tateyamensis TaxID=565073 RepID=UPI001C64C6F3
MDAMRAGFGIEEPPPHSPLPAAVKPWPGTVLRLASGLLPSANRADWLEEQRGYLHVSIHEVR